MNWKEFLKPEKRKIILFFMFILTYFITAIILPNFITNAIYLDIVSIFFSIVFLPLMFFLIFFVTTMPSSNYILLIIALISTSLWLYFLCCLICRIYNKAKNK
jgi:hypothetical protein